MPRSYSSRRQLLGGLLFALGGWLWPAKPSLAASLPEGPLAPSQGMDRFLKVAEYRYDSQGRILSVVEKCIDDVTTCVFD